MIFHDLVLVFLNTVNATFATHCYGTP